MTIVVVAVVVIGVVVTELLTVMSSLSGGIANPGFFPFSTRNFNPRFVVSYS